MSDLINLKRGAQDCSKFSGGQRQALAFMRMIAQNGQIILLDESFNAMSPDGRNYFFNLLFSSKMFSDKTILMITHDIDSKILERFDGIFNVENGVLTQIK